MTALYPSRNRRRIDPEEGRRASFEEEITPSPVAVSIRGEALPAPSRRAPTRPLDLRRLALGVAALGLFAGGAVAITGTLKADADSFAESTAARALMTHALTMPLNAPEPPVPNRDRQGA